MKERNPEAIRRIAKNIEGEFWKSKAKNRNNTFYKKYCARKNTDKY